MVGLCDVLVGVVVVGVDGIEFVWVVNVCEVFGDFIVYVEILVMWLVVGVFGDGWWLEGIILVVIVELCIMCVGVLVLVCVVWLVFGVWEFKIGVVGLLWDVVCDCWFNYCLEVCGGVFVWECVVLLEVFFVC